MADGVYLEGDLRKAGDITNDVVTPNVIISGPGGALLGSGLGLTASADFTPAAAAYGAGDIMDVPKELSFTDRNGVLVPPASLIRITTAVVKIDVTAVPSGQTGSGSSLACIASDPCCRKRATG